MASSSICPSVGPRLVARSTALLACAGFGLGFLAAGEASAALTSSANYAIQSQVLASGGGRTASGSFNLLSTVGQSSPLGRPSSANFALLPGFLATLDSDADGYPDHVDAFPLDDSEQLDSDGDGIGNNADSDDDNDGMSDEYETTYGLDPLDDRDASQDNDGDGLTNLEEFQGGETDPTDPESFPVHVADFDGDFRSDILWRNIDVGNTSLWLMDGFDREASQSIGAPGTVWQVRALADFNADEMTDVLWRETSKGKVVGWLMQGFDRLDTGDIGAPGLEWRVDGTGDFDGDDDADILWRHTVNATAVVWEMNGLDKLGSEVIGGPPLVWQVDGTGDFDGGGKADILWRHTDNGTAVVWLMDGSKRAGSDVIGGPPLVWQVVATGDFTAGGKLDILWRHTEKGTAVVWEMDGLNKLDSGVIGGPPLDWRVEPSPLEPPQVPEGAATAFAASP